MAHQVGPVLGKAVVAGKAAVIYTVLAATTLHMLRWEKTTEKQRMGVSNT
jgi:hypothetical protein